MVRPRVSGIARCRANPRRLRCVLRTSEETSLEPEIRAFIEDDYRRVVAAVALVCGSKAGAEDAVQEALARGWERMSRGERLDSVTAWVTVVATNLARSAVRRRLAERRAAARSRSGGGAPQMPEEALDVVRALGLLPRRQREAVVMHYWLTMSVAEIASALGVSEGTVKSALHRARRRLDAELRETPEVTA